MHTSQKELEKSILDAGAEFVRTMRGGDGKIFIMKDRISYGMANQENDFKLDLGSSDRK